MSDSAENVRKSELYVDASTGEHLMPVQSPPQYDASYSVQTRNTDKMPVQTIVIADASLLVGPDSVVIECPGCHQRVQTVVEYESGTLTWLVVLALCLFCPCFCCVPCCVDRLKDAIHFCPNCKTVLGQFRRL